MGTDRINYKSEREVGSPHTDPMNKDNNMTQINYNFMHTPSMNGEDMMDRTIFIPEIGECVWVNWAQSKTGHRIIDVHCKEDVLNNFNPLLAYNVHPYTACTDDCLAGDDPCNDASFVGNVMRIAYQTDDKGAVAIIGYFVHPRFRGKGLAKMLLVAGFKIIESYTDLQTIVLNPKSHSTSPVSTAVLRKWYEKMGFQELGAVFRSAGLHTPSNKKIYKQFPKELQRKVRKEGDHLLVMTNGSWDIQKANQIAGFGLINLLSDWS
jgi:GNAT superfamily N-acetyltransferase